MKIVKFYITISLLAFSNLLFAQTDTTFWFAAPDVTFDGGTITGLDRPIELHITTGNIASTVTISLPANPTFIPITQNVSANSNSLIDLTTWIDLIESKPANQVLNTGLLIQSTNKITAYYEVSSINCNYCNPEIFTLKGNNALGTNFFIPAQDFMYNSFNSNYNPPPKSSFDIIATENNTIVTITPTKDIVGHLQSVPFTINLNKGQTYSATAISSWGADHLMGSIVSASKKIAITIKDDLMSNSTMGTCSDLGGDQIIPISILGTKYIPVKGYLNSNFEKVFVLAVSNGTQVTINGVLVATLNAGNTFRYDLTNPTAYIETSLPTYILHMSGFGCEVGLDVLPSIECTGSSSLSVTRSAPQPLFLNLLVPAGGQNFFKYNGLTGIINAGDFTVVPGSGGQYLYASKQISTATTPAGTNFTITNSNKRFQMGVIHGDQTGGCRFGYFSDYNTFKANMSANGPTFCSADTLRLQVDSITGSIIQWTGPGGFTSNIANPKLFLNNATQSGYYKVTVNDPTCGMVTDSILINVTIPNVITSNNATICGNTPVQLNTTGALTYSWTPTTGLNNPNVANPIATPLVTTQYIVTGTTATGCVGKDTVVITVSPSSNFDFSYKQDVCNPLSVQFFAAGATPVNAYWNFGDGQTASGVSNPTHTFATLGTYIVKYHIDNFTCADTITKTISLQLTNADIVITPDTTICFGTTKLLRALPSGSFCWSPTTYLSNPNSSTPTTSTPQNITYYYTAEILGNNLITNGNFSAGNTGFTSDYTYATNNTVEGQYFVGTNPVAWNSGAAVCSDHTTGAGNMLLVNGAPTPNTTVWKQTVNLTPNTNYNFTCWAQSIYFADPAQLQFSINNILIGPIFSPGGITCNWQRFFSNWNSGNNTTATISIVNLNTVAGGNDFALDDISFATVDIKRDSVKIIVDTPHVNATGTTSVCAGTSSNLSATGANSYVWMPPTGLSNANIANPIATPTTSTTYTVTGTSINGCTAQSSATITILPKPIITKTADATICNNASIQLNASGGTNYVWTPAATLSNANIANPIATPTASFTKYYVTVTNNAVNNCTNKDSVQITVRPAPVFTISPANITCSGTSVQLNAGGGDSYLWSPANLVSNVAINNPLAIATTTTTYSVTITETACNTSQTLQTIVTVNPLPSITASSSNDIDCSNDLSNLLATGATQFIWSPSATLNNSNIANPIAKPLVTTQYIVKGTNQFGCANYDSISVKVSTSGKSGYFMPNSFTPNGDGKNDCFGIKYWGPIQNLEFMIYNRYGERVFYTNNPNQCWNGLYKSDKPEPGNYVYYIKATSLCGTIEKKGNVILIR